MFKSIFILFIAQFIFTSQAFSNDVCSFPEQNNMDGEEILKCVSQAKIKVGINSSAGQEAPKFSAVVNLAGNSLTAQVYQNSGGCMIKSTAHRVKIVGSNPSGICKLTLTDIENSKQLEIRMTAGGLDELIHYRGIDVSKKDIHILECSSNFYDDLLKKYCNQ